MGARYFGAAVQRKEDDRLVVGRGRYLDDVALPGMLHGAYVRASDAHARILNVDVGAARAVPGVVAVFTARDFGTENRPTAQMAPSPLLQQAPTWSPLADKHVCYVGEPVAMVVAETRGIAEDAAALVIVETDPLPAVTNYRSALDPGAPPAHADLKSNLAASMQARFGDVAGVFARAARVIPVTLEMHRGGCHAMECRGVVAAWSTTGDELTVYSSTQSPYPVRKGIARHLGLDEHRVRVIAPDVGGGFGPKAVFYPEELSVPLAAQRVGSPVKWIEDRREHILATTQQRDQLWTVEVAVAADGRLLGLRGRIIHDNGAYLPYGLILPATTVQSLPGPYALEALDVTLDVALTNFVPTTPVRGAGRPNAAFAMERIADIVAREFGLDPAEVRRRSFVKAAQMPYPTGLNGRDGTPIAYDGCDFHQSLELASARFDVGDFRRRQAAARAEGRYLGMGIATYVEDTGLAPFEGATVRVDSNGRVIVETGAASQGQGHATIFAQIVADQLGVGIADVTVKSADTGVFPLGIGTIASRVAVTGGSSVLMAARNVRAKALKIAAVMLECPEGDLTLEDGHVQAGSGSNKKLPLGALAARLEGIPGLPMPPGIAPGLSDTSYFEARQTTFACGSNIAEVEVDIETGGVTVHRYVVAHDCGLLINPMLVDGQIRGGVVHGIGNALFERMIYDDGGQPLTTNYGEYLLPTATEMPNIEIVHTQTPSERNPLGVKGAGEGGTIPATACIIAAIEDALSPFGVALREHPVSPQRLIELLADKS